MGPVQPGRVPEHSAILVRLSKSDYQTVAESAERDGTSLGGYVRTLVRRHIEATEPVAA